MIFRHFLFACIFSYSLLCSHVFAQDSCVDRIYASTDKEITILIRSDASLERTKFCASTFDEYKSAKGWASGATYGAIYGHGNYNQDDYDVKRKDSCSEKDSAAYKTEFVGRLTSSIGVEKLRVLCPGIRFACYFDQKALTLAIHNNDPNRTTRYFYAGPPAESGSLRVVDKNKIKAGAELFHTDPVGPGFIIPLELVPGKKSETGSVTITLHSGPNPKDIGLADTCYAFKPNKEDIRELITSAGSQNMETAIMVQPTFSRIRNSPDGREYEWFKFVAPADGTVEAQLYAKDAALQLRLHVAPNNLAVSGNGTIVKAGATQVVVFEVGANKIYLVGIQAYSGGPTGAQLDVSFARK